MSIAQQSSATAPVLQPPARQPSGLHNGRWAGFRHLLRARMLELAREREVMFWVFGFPLLLALGLGFAFRDKPADKTTIAIASGADAQRLISLLQNSPQHSAIHAEVLD